MVKMAGEVGEGGWEVLFTIFDLIPDVYPHMPHQ